jgi:hypothetical protein
VNPVFTLPYTEFEAISQLARVLKKQDGFAIFIPVSRQQQGVDLLLLNYRTRRSLRVQVKSSRAYVKKTQAHLRFWYNNFVTKYRRGTADIYVFTALFPAYSVGHHVRERRRFWRTAVLVFTDAEIRDCWLESAPKRGSAIAFGRLGSI